LGFRRTCQIECPQPCEHIRVQTLADGQPIPVKIEAGVVLFESKAGSPYLVFHAGHAVTEAELPQPRRGTDSSPKKWNANCVGMIRFF